MITVGTPDRDETETERLDRNWASLLQELRVAQTGVTLLTGFLLTLPFQQRFTELDSVMRTVYLVTVACSIGSTVLLVAPVGMHRLLFRRHRLEPPWYPLRMAMQSPDCCSWVFALVGVSTVIFDVVVGRPAAWIAGGCTLAALACFWFLLPLRERGQTEGARCVFVEW